MTRTIRIAFPEDIPAILTVIEAARGIMHSSGNPSQWKNGYPSEAVIRSDIDSRYGYVVLDNGIIKGFFAFIPSPEPTYSVIYGGRWLEDTSPYHVIHRIASTQDSHGIFRSIMDWCFQQDKNIRIDTHKDNRIMQHCILSYGFQYCGIIYLQSGDPRLAYQAIK